MRVATKLSVAFGLFVLLMGSLLIFHIRTIRQAVTINYELSELATRAYTATTRQVIRIGRIEENASKYRVTRDDGYLENFSAALAAFQEGLHHIDTGRLSERELIELEALIGEWETTVGITTRFRDTPFPTSSSAEDPILDELLDSLSRLRAKARALGEASQEMMVARLEDSARAARRAERIASIVFVGALIIAVTGAGMIIRSITDALRRLQRGTREVAAGNFDYRLEALRDDEFSHLAHDFNTMTERLGELDQMKKEFLSKVSHDLKTPLASILETTRALLEEVPGPLTERQERLLQLNHQSGERLSAMIGKILELSALESGALDFDPEPTEFTSLVELAIEEVRLAHQEEGSAGSSCPDLSIEADADPPSLFVSGDGGRLTRVIVNLLENAVKFSPPGSPINVRISSHDTPPPGVPEEKWESVVSRDRPGGSALLLSIIDRGPGIPDHEKDAIFERFFQSETGKKTHRRGVGLGLTICQEIVTAHRGTIWVDDAPGGGSIFNLLLPELRVEGETMAGAPSHPAERQRSRV